MRRIFEFMRKKGILVAMTVNFIATSLFSAAVLVGADEYEMLTKVLIVLAWSTVSTIMLGIVATLTACRRERQQEAMCTIIGEKKIRPITSSGVTRLRY